MPTPEFWSITPREFFALAQRHQKIEEMANYRAGIIAAAVYNARQGRPKSAPVIKPLQFFGEPAEKQGEPREMEPEQLMAVMKGWALEVKERLRMARGGT